MTYWKDRKVLVTGPQGFIGRHTVLALKALEAKVFESSADLSLRSSAMSACEGIDTVIHLAAHVGGIGYASRNHPEMLLDNLRLNTTMLQAAYESGVKTFVYVSSACVYPDVSPNPMTEDYGWLGEPVRSSQGYGWAKRMGEISSQLVARWTKMRVVIARPFNAYGPGDKLDPESSHVIPAILEKLKRPGPIPLWGSGLQVRSFTYVSDWVEALLFMAQHGPNGEPINLGGDDKGTKLMDLVELLLELTHDERSIRDVLWQHGPEGHMVRVPDLTWLKTHGWAPSVPLRDGLEKTIAWWRTQSA